MKIYFSGGGGFCLKRKIKKIFERAIEESGLGFKNFSVSVAFVSEEEIKRLNREFRKIDKVTDVLSFPSLELVDKKLSLGELASEISPLDGSVNLGDIAICQSVARAQAEEYGHSYSREVCFLALHGLLHLLGYDHETAEEESEMMGFAERVLSEFGLGRKYV